VKIDHHLMITRGEVQTGSDWAVAPAQMHR
jgi:hypothetical protein